jgi:hypothetical protein
MCILLPSDLTDLSLQPPVDHVVVNVLLDDAATAVDPHQVIIPDRATVPEQINVDADPAGPGW